MQEIKIPEIGQELKSLGVEGPASQQALNQLRVLADHINTTGIAPGSKKMMLAYNVRNILEGFAKDPNNKANLDRVAGNVSALLDGGDVKGGQEYSKQYEPDKPQKKAGEKPKKDSNNPKPAPAQETPAAPQAPKAEAPAPAAPAQETPAAPQAPKAEAPAPAAPAQETPAAPQAPKAEAPAPAAPAQETPAAPQAAQELSQVTLDAESGDPLAYSGEPGIFDRVGSYIASLIKPNEAVAAEPAPIPEPAKPAPAPAAAEPAQIPAQAPEKTLPQGFDKSKWSTKPITDEKAFTKFCRADLNLYSSAIGYARSLQLATETGDFSKAKEIQDKVGKDKLDNFLSYFPEDRLKAATSKKV